MNTRTEPTGKQTRESPADLRNRVVDATQSRKGHQRRWKALTYSVAAGEPGAREELDTVEHSLRECDRELAQLYAAIEEAEAPNTEPGRASDQHR